MGLPSQAAVYSIEVPSVVNRAPKMVPLRYVSWRNSGIELERECPTKNAAPRAASKSSATAGQIHGRDFGGGSAVSFEVRLMLVSVSRSKARSCADWKRSAGFFSRQCRTMRSSAGETLEL